ncbi:MAG: class II aldolase/adducin family protein [Actinomycetota bacterium]|nr:class II aldolase/adducin family protein [Actinomycetota bacterium]
MEEVEGRELREGHRDRAVSVSEEALRLLRQELVEICRRSYERGLVAGVSGNASIRLPGPDAGLVLIKSTGCSLGDMTVADTMLMDLEGRALEPGRQPSMEWRWHLGLYRMRSDVGGVIHLHPPYTVAWAVANQVPPLVHTAARGALERLDIVELAPSGSPELAKLVLDAFGADPELRVALMREHGMLAAASTLRAAFYLADYLEDTAKVALLSAQVVGALGMREELSEVAPVGWRCG